MTVVTKFHKRNPFSGESPNPVKHVDPKTLRISTDECPSSRTSKYKYDEVFSKLKVGQCVVCEWNEVGRISAAMRSWIKRHDRDNTVKSNSYFSSAAPTGRVWLL